jgi:adenosine deaminase
VNFRAIPKIDLHRHIEGAIRYETMKEWIIEDKHPIDPQNEKRLKEYILIKEPVDGLKIFLEKFGLIHQVLSAEKRIERMAYEACEDAFSEGVRILELRYSPIFIKGDREKLTFEKIHQAILGGIRQAQTYYPMAVGLTGIIGREWPLKVAEQVTDFFIENRSTTRGLDLANDEAHFDCKPFAPLFQKAKKNGLHITIHAGESNIPGSSESIRNAIDLLGAERIGHGIQAYRDEKIMRYIRDKK